MNITQVDFGTLPDGRMTTLYTLTNNHGAAVAITNYGGIVVGIVVPDREGKRDDVVLGFDDLAGYLAQSPYFGAIVGRCCNRLNRGQFTLAGRTYQLAVNEAPQRQTHLHGGNRGFDKMLWSATPRVTATAATLELRYFSPDGEENYPGNLTVTARYSWDDDYALRLELTATTDRTTIVNLTNHSYFNLAGAGSGPVTGHLARINAEHYTPVSAELIPTGEIRPVAGTPFDFTVAKPIGRDIDAADGQIAIGGGYDHNFVLCRPTPGALTTAAEVYEPTTGRTLEVLTTQPAVQFYTGNGLGSEIGKGHRRYPRRGGFCFEPQRYPDAPHHDHFPSIVLTPDQTYRETVVFRFGVK
ncbi:MAG: galactose mutarotase [Victivallales bacterium]|nr:galactose mutarotase [Victivallales bacterium]